MNSKKYLKVGKIVGTRGIAGEVKVKHYCDTAEAFCDIENFYFSPEKVNRLNIITKRIFKNLILIKIDKINAICDAEKLVGNDVYAFKDDITLPDGRYFVDDILGMDVIDSNNGISYGKIYDIMQNGAHDVYCIRDTLCNEYFLPAVNEMIDRIDTQKNIVFVRPVKGIFND